MLKNIYKLSLVVFFSITATLAQASTTEQTQSFDAKLKTYTHEKAKDIQNWISKFKQNIYKWTLSNGLTVLFYKKTDTPEVFMQIEYNVGSKDEAPHEYGYAHCVEHMIFKGTEKLSESDIGEIAKKFGAHFNALTTKDTTTFFFESDKKNWPIFLQIFADCMQNVRFDQNQFASELGAIINEIKMRDAQPLGAGFDLLSQYAFARNHPYSHPIIGYKENLINSSAQDLKNFYKKHYTSNNAVLTLVGDIDQEILRTEIEKNFGSILAPQTKKQSLPVLAPEDLLQSNTTIYRYATCAQILYAFKVPGATEPDSFITPFVSNILNEYLTRTLLNTKKLYSNVFNISCIDSANMLSANSLSGMLYIFASPKNPCANSFWDWLFGATNASELCSQYTLGLTGYLAQNGITEEELARYKKLSLSIFLNTFSNTQEIAATLSRNYISTKNEFNAFDEFFKIQKITNDDIKAFCKKYLRPTLMHTVYCSPIPPEEQKNWEELQTNLDKYDQELLAKQQRESKLEEPISAKTLPEPETLEFKFEKPDEIFTLSNGLDVILKKRTNEPYLSLQISFKNDFMAKLKFQSQNQDIIKKLSTSLMSAGTQTYTEVELVNFFESINAFAGSGYLSCLPEDLEFATEKLVHILQYPAYPNQKLDQAINNSKAFILDQQKDAAHAINKELDQHFFKNYTWVKTDEERLQQLKKINRSKLRNFHNQYINPQNMFLVIVGNFDKTQIKAQLEQIFGVWKKHGTTFDFTNFSIPQISNPIGKRIVKNFPLEQCIIATTRLVPEITKPEFISLQMLEQYLQKKLFEIREQTGIFYSIGSSLTQEATLKTKGLACINTLVSKNNLTKAEEAIKTVLTEICNNGLTKNELATAKYLYLTNKAKNFSSNYDYIYTYQFIYSNNLSWDYLENRIDLVKKLTLDEVNQVARKYLNPDEWTFAIAGRVEEENGKQNETPTIA